MEKDAAYDELVVRAVALVPVLRARAADTELLRRLPDETLADLHESGLFRAFRPARYGGLEVPIRFVAEVGAIVARGCASASWVLNNLLSHNWMLGYWPEAAQDEVWGRDPDALIGSAFIMSGGRARRVEGGYRLTGRWPFSSGIDPVRWVMLAGLATGADGAPPEPRFFVVPREDCTIIDTWHVMGLCGTGSKDVAVEDVFVPDHRAVPAAVGKGAPHPGSAVNSGALYRLPWYPIFSFVNGGTALGIAQGAVEQFRAEMSERIGPATGREPAWLGAVQLRLAEAAAMADGASALMLRDCDEAQAMVAAGHAPSLSDRARWRRDGAYGATLSARAVDLVFAGAGGGAIAAAHPLQRALRDIRAATGHIGLNWDLNGGLYGKVSFGLDPDFPFL